MANPTDKQTSERVDAVILKAKIPARPDRDEITLAKSIFDQIVEITEHEETPKERRARSGGQARAAKLSSAKRKAIAKKAADARWVKT